MERQGVWQIRRPGSPLCAGTHPGRRKRQEVLESGRITAGEASEITALKPIENRRVRGVASERYPLNDKCAHLECSEPAADPHHIFPRSAIGNDSWFVEIETGAEHPEFTPGKDLVTPHVSGLCRKHHDDVEEHRAWIKLEEGMFVWYDRDREDFPGKPDTWERIGPLNPQPGSREGKPKRKPRGQAREGKSETWTLRAPKGESMETLLEVLETCSQELRRELGSPEPPLPYVTISMLAAHYLQTR